MGMDMKSLCICLIFIFAFFGADFKFCPGIAGIIAGAVNAAAAKSTLSAMEALDLVKDKFAADFEQQYYSLDMDLYCYKLPDAELYLAYEGLGESEDEYLIHLYEFVCDDHDSGMGHSYTYAWYTVNRVTGCITVYKP